MTKTKTQKARAKQSKAVVATQPNGGVGKKKKQNRGNRNAVQRQSAAAAVILGGVATRRPRMTDILGHRIRWTLGYVYVGNGTNGATNAVLFETTNAGTIFGAQTNPAVVPILGSDGVLGKTYISDITKHFSRKVINRMAVELNALIPSTGSAMMVALAAFRGPSLCPTTIPYALATAGATANTLDNILSVEDRLVCESFRDARMDITHLIAGGNGPKENEFNIAAQNNVTTVVANSTALSGTVPGGFQGIVPACVAVGGNNTIAAYQAQQMFEVVIEQEIHLLDYAGGMATAEPLV